MIFRCALCNQAFELDQSYYGRCVECACGNKWNFPKDLDSLVAQEIKIDISLIQSAIPPPVWKSAFDCETEAELKRLDMDIQRYSEHQYRQSLEVSEIKSTSTPEEAYQRIKNIVLFDTPVPAVYKVFIKICRQINREDKKAGNIKSIAMRVKLMKKIAQKHIDTIWNNMSQLGPVRHTTKAKIKEQYWLITVTDEKNSRLRK